jgi:D-3-phosphoglycerate dehydrogenase
MLTKIMPVFSRDQINIENMTNKSQGSYAYSVFDVNSEVDEKAVQELSELDGVIRVRVLK